MFRKLLLVTAMICVLSLGVVGIALADSTGNRGQPNQNCDAQTSAPGGGNSSQSTGSPFNGGSSGNVYANPGVTPKGGPNAGDSNPNAVSQYDVACFQVSH